MSIIFCDSFDHYQMVLQKWDAWLPSGTGNVFPATINIGVGRNGGSALGFGAGGIAPQQAQKNFPNAATMFCGFALNVDVSGTNGDISVLEWYDGASLQIGLRLSPAGHFYFVRGTTQLGSPSSNALPFRAWHYIECLITINSSTGVCQLNVDGVSWLNLTSQNTSADGNAFVGALRIGYGITTLSKNPILFDDFYLANTSGSFNTSFLGDVRVQALLPTANGSTLNYTMAASAWAANTVMGVGQTILDSNGNLQRVTSVTSTAKTGGMVPTWNVTLNGTTTDNTVTWTNIGAQSQFLTVNQNPPEGAASREPNSAYTVGTLIWDTNRNLQLCTTGGTSASSTSLTWNGTLNGTTSDGSVTWTNIGQGEDTYLLDSTVSDISRFTYPAIFASSIKAVAINPRARKDDAGARSIRGAIKSGATTGDTGTDLVLSTTYQILQGISESDPNTSAAWTQAGFNAAEFGVKTTA